MTIGILLALGSGLLFAAGNVAQKQAVGGMAAFSVRTPLATIAAIARSWIWLIGAFLSVAGVLVQIAAYRRTSIAVVQAVCAFGVIALLIVARVIFGERLSKREEVGALCALAALGLVIASMSNVGSSAPLIVLRTELAMGATVAVTALLLSSLALTHRSGGGFFGLGSGLLYGATGLGVKGASAAFSSSGVIHGVERLLTGPIPYSLAFTWISALLLFQMGIQRSRLSIVAPLSTVVSTVFVIAIGTPLFGEAWPGSGLRVALRALSLIAILVALVFVLAPEERKQIKTIATSSVDESRTTTGIRSAKDLSTNKTSP